MSQAHFAIPLYSILLVWSLLGNVLVIAVVYYNVNLRTNMNYLIVNMAVSDLLVPLVAVPWWISLYATDSKWLVDGPLGEALCKLVPFLSHVAPLVSSISLVMIAFQRYIAVVYPTRRQLSFRKTRCIAISFPWIVAMSFNSPFFNNHLLLNGITSCKTSPLMLSILTPILTFFGFVIPLIAIVTLYTIIVHRIRKTLNNVMDMVAKETIRLRQRKNRRIFSMLMTIVVMFIICWCPLFVYSLSSKAKSKFFYWYMWYLQAAINPSIYFVFLRDFRKGLVKIFFCRKIAPTRGGDGNEEPMQHLQHPSSNQLLPINHALDDPEHQEIVTRTQHVHHLTSIPLQSRMNINTRRPRTPGGDSNQDPTCTPPHINTTSV